MDKLITLVCWNRDRVYMTRQVAKILDPELARTFDPIKIPGLGIWCLDPQGTWFMRFDSSSGMDLVHIYSIDADSGILSHIANRIS